MCSYLGNQRTLPNKLTGFYYKFKKFKKKTYSPIFNISTLYRKKNIKTKYMPIIEMLIEFFAKLNSVFIQP